MSATPIQSPASQTAPLAPRYKMAVARWIALFPPLVVITVLASPLLATLPPLVRVFVVSVVLVALMTWVTMPLVTKWLAFWLLPAPKKHKRN